MTFRLHNFFRNLVHRILAVLLLLVAAIPIFMIFYFLMKIIGNQKEPFFYKGERLGKDKRPFNLYKIRTLPRYAEHSLNQELFRPGRDIELKYGKFLRKTRIDELPQLINIIKGDMNLVGPRPVRSTVARRFSPNIPGYDHRFAVRPGLAGYSQLFTAHRTPKRIRSGLDNHFVRHHAGLISDLSVVMSTIFRAVRRAFLELYRGMITRLRIHKAHGTFTNLRALHRVPGHGTESCITPDSFDTSKGRWHRVDDIDYHAIRLKANERLNIGDCITFVLRKTVQRRKRVRRARCHGVVFAEREHPGETAAMGEYVIFYTPDTDFSRYIIDQYMLDEKI